MIKLEKIKLWAIVLMTGAIAVWTQSCNKDEPSDADEVDVTSVTVAPDNAKLTVGDSVKLTATISPDNATNKDVTWTSSNTGVATVNSNGVVRALTAGTTNIIVTSSGNSAKTATCVITCSSNEPTDVPVTDLTVTPKNATLTVGDSVTLTATVSPDNATNKDVTWTSSDSNVATVSSAGVVKALAAGTANIVVKSASNSEKTTTVEITVKAAVSVSLDPTSLLIPVGATRTLKVSPDDVSQEVIWSSDDANVVTIDIDGMVTAVGPGTTTITVMYEDATAECTVTVVDLSSIPASRSLVGMWTFEDAAALGKATVGEDLEVNGVFTSVDGPNSTKAVVADENAYFTITHNIGANGGGEYTNEYTLMMDIRGSQEGFNEWLSVFESGAGNGGLLWIDSNGKIGYDALGGYSRTTLTPDTWHRVVVAVKLGESFKVYIDGALVFTATQTIELDGDMSLYTDVAYIGYDNGGYSGPDFAEVRMWGVRLTDEEVATLGSPSTMLP
jgi:uncharacterized protein YjdB